MILGAVMGAAGRIEAERRRQQQVSPAIEEVSQVRAEFEQSLKSEAPSKPGVELPGLDRDLIVRRRGRPSIFKHRPGAAHEPAERRHTLPSGPSFEERRRQPLTRSSDATADMAYRQRFGNYAGLAEAELTTYRDLEDDTPGHANSNTARTAPTDEEAAVVVPFPASAAVAAQPAPVARPALSFAERIAAALGAEPSLEGGDQRPTIGVELRRETATFHVPVSEASLPEALMKLTGRTLQIDAETPVQPQLEHSLAEQIPAIAAEEAPPIALYDESLPQEIDGADFEPPRVLRRMVE